MKKFIVALAAVAMTAGIANAQDTKTQKCDGPQACNSQQCGNPGDCKKAYCPFDGLNLTDAQKAQIKEIRAKQAEACKANCPDKQAKKDAKKAEKQARREARQQARRDFLAQVKTVLTPEQYIQFLENNFVNSKGDRQGPRPDGKHHKDGKRGPQQCPRAPQK